MQTAIIKLVSTKAKDIDSIASQIKEITKSINIKCNGPIPLPTKVISQTTRKAPSHQGSHTYERWEMRFHKRLITIESSEQALRQIMRIVVPDTVQIEMSLG
ncbi:MAG: 30S ribosomal protein S10 [Candidatus Marsarchaeota archaeon]|jgi:small subunit ribosomal protein S10|nr:30S ribosomal protein S10 [Candidatus Marsarchaeota archaeon]MCL5111483.1 30S ribosomal protein S10 [Candidatus Marsarchaeota archaeon]